MPDTAPPRFGPETPASAAAQRASKRIVRIVPIAVVAIVVAIVVGAFVIPFAVATNNVNAVKADEGIAVAVTSGTIDRYRSNKRSRYEIVYTYEVDGEVYRIEKPGFSSRYRAQEFLREHGRHATAHYERAHPDNAFLTFESER